MIVLVERVRAATVSSGDEILGAIGRGLLVQVGFARGDGGEGLTRAARRILSLRIFPDERGRFARDCLATGAGILLVPAFALAAEAATSGRLDLGSAESPAVARALFERLRATLEACHPGCVASGRFAAAMTIRAEHDGPVPFVLCLPPSSAEG